MSYQNTGVFPLHAISRCVRDLDKATRDLSEVMTGQLNAVISADAEKVMALTEKNVEVQQHFHEKEQAFISELKQLIVRNGNDNGNDNGNTPPVTLEGLKQIYPEYEIYIREWQEQITGNIGRLERQEKQLVQLLDFAQKQNAALMRSVYSLQSKKNLHYRQNGEKSGVSSGIAVNQEG